jgi:2,3-bisphosphoglycerate-dependent phosphoglycerate mutase
LTGAPIIQLCQMAALRASSRWMMRDHADPGHSSPAGPDQARRVAVPARKIGQVAIELVFETHSTTVDNEQGHATGWLPGQLSERGRVQAQQLGHRRRGDGITAVFSSDLARAAQTASVAFAGSAIPVLYDWRLRECDYGQRNGMPAAELHAGRREHLDRPYPGGESWRQAVARVGRFLGDLSLRWNGQRILLIGHVATRWGLDHFIGGIPLEDLVEQDFAWQEGWEYRLS